MSSVARPASPGTSRPGGAGQLGISGHRRWPRRALIGVNILVLVMLVVAGSAYAYVRLTLGKISHVVVHGLKYTAPSSPMTILAVGSDTRSLGSGDSAAFGSSSQVSGQRSDTIMLIRVVPASHSIAIMSVPRDLLVPVAGYGTTRINAAFNNGPDLLVSTIEQDLGIPVNHFMVVNFYSFTRIADAIGGVYQYFPTPARDLNSGLTVTSPGCVLLKGANALGFVRSREYQYYLNGSWQYQMSPESDLARIQRQQDFVKLAIKKAEHVVNPLAINSVLSGIAGSLTVDNNFSTSMMLGLAETFRHANVAGIPNWTYPTVNSVDVPGALDPVASEDQAMVQQFLDYGLPANSANPATPGSSATPGTTSSSAAPTSGGDVAVADATLTVATLSGDYLASGPTSTGTTSTGTASTGTTSTGTGATGGLTTPSDQVQVDASSYYNGQYVPPGRAPGQVPEQCPQ